MAGPAYTKTKKSFATYEEAMAYLEGLINYERVAPPKYSDAAFDLRGMEKLLKLIGSPHRMPCAHVAGTKGKGSTSSILAAILQAHGVRTGLYTSPHVLAWEERISVNGEWIGKDSMRRLISEIRPTVDRLKKRTKTVSPTFFEVLTALAWIHFRKESVRLAVMEVGLGGRLDATNVCFPVACGITNIDYDHVKMLGSTLESIATEKAGIIKREVPVVSSPQGDEAKEVIRARAKEMGAALYVVGEDIEVTKARPRGLGTSFSVRTPWFEFSDLYVPLVGRHQAVNAGVAIGMAKLVADAGHFRLDEGCLRQGLANVKLLARAEVVAKRPTVVIDGGHNPAAVRVLVSALRNSMSYERLIVVVGIMKDKDVPLVLKELAETDVLIATSIDYPRAMPAEELAALAREHTKAAVVKVDGPANAFRHAHSMARPGDLICVTGSFYLAGEIRALYPH